MFFFNLWFCSLLYENVIQYLPQFRKDAEWYEDDLMNIQIYTWFCSISEANFNKCIYECNC